MLAVAFVLGIAVVNAGWGQQGPKRVLIVPREGSIAPDLMIKREVLVIKQILTQAGYDVEVATVSGKPIRGKDQILEANAKVGDVDLSRYSGLVLACMAAGSIGEWHASQDEKSLATDAAQRGMLVGAQASALITLAEAGLLDGKHYCYYKNPGHTEGFVNGQYSGLGVIRDGILITSSSCPYVPVQYGPRMKDYTSQFAADFVRALSE
jgi:putative intracellular protease/amidase